MCCRPLEPPEPVKTKSSKKKSDPNYLKKKKEKDLPNEEENANSKPIEITDPLPEDAPSITPTKKSKSSDSKHKSHKKHKKRDKEKGKEGRKEKKEKKKKAEKVANDENLLVEME